MIDKDRKDCKLILHMTCPIISWPVKVFMVYIYGVDEDVHCYNFGKNQDMMYIHM